MRPSSRKTIIWLTVLVAAAAWFLKPVISARVDRAKCKDVLWHMGAVVHLYRDEHNGHPPSSIEELFKGYGFSEKLFTCPAIKRTGGFSVANWNDELSRGGIVGDDFPLIYDRSLMNHNASGVNVLTVGGEVIWDADATLIADYARRYPSAGIVVEGK